MMKKILIHKSGRKTLASCPVGIEDEVKIREANGKIDEVIEEIEVGKMSDKHFESMMEKPQKFDIKRYKLRTIRKT